MDKFPYDKALHIWQLKNINVLWMLEDSTLVLAIASYHFLHVLNLSPFLKLCLLNVLLIFLLYINIMLQWAKSLKMGFNPPAMYIVHNINYSQFFPFTFLCVNFLKKKNFKYQNILPLSQTHNKNIPINNKMFY
jgi:hypothetical protein